MRSFVLVILFLSLTNTQLSAESLRKPYFAATPTGAWAKYESNWEMSDGKTGSNLYTYIRVSDNANRVRFEIETETVSGPGKGMISRQLNIMESGFDLAMNFLNHIKHTEASVAQVNDGSPSVTQDKVIEIIRESGGDLTNSVIFKSKADVQGRKCDHYTYSFKTGGPHVTLHEGEIWLDETVPFGLVLQKGKVMEASGKPRSTFTQKLLDFGTGKAGTAALLALAPKPRQAASEKAVTKALQSQSFLEAYESEKIRLLVKVKKGSGGKHLILKALNKTKESFDIVVPKGPLTINAGSPLEVLRLVVSKEQRFSLPPSGSSPPISVGQSGKRGAIEGRFELTIYKGEPLLTGSVKVGPL